MPARGLIILTKINTNEIITRQTAKALYRTQHTVMVITNEVDQGDNDLGYVMYISDDERELPSVSRDKYKDKMIAFMSGIAAEPYPQIGNVVYYYQV